MSGGTCVILGAGFSRWAADLPVVGGLFDMAITPLNGRESMRLRSIESLKQRWVVTHPGGNNEQFVADILSGDKSRARLHLLWYLTRRLSEPFVATITRGFQTLMIDDSRKLRLPGIVKAASFFARLEGLSLTGIVTPN
jgi:hypothetical protein